MSNRRRYQFIILIVLLLIPLQLNFAQDDNGGAPIDFTGTVESINGTTIVVGGLPVDISGVSINADLSVGISVQISGSLVNGVVIAQVVVIQIGDNSDNGSTLSPSVDLQKYVSLDGGATWDDADDAPGPDAALGGQAAFRFVVTNDGNVDLTAITLTDSVFDLSTCTIPETLAVGAFFECQIGPFDVVEGQHANLATVNASFVLPTGDNNSQGDDDDQGDDNSGLLIATDPAYYFGGDRAEIDVRKYVSVDGGVFDEADSEPGAEVPLGSAVSYRIEVINSGNVALSGITLVDEGYDLSGCTIPESLDADGTFDCVIGPFTVEAEGQATNTATVSATFNDQTVTDSDSASYFGGEIDASDLPVIVVIEGPVVSINVNIITIYDFEIELDDNDPLLTVIQIGDIVRVEGAVDDFNGLTIVIVPITIVIVNVEINIVDGTVWRDEGNCNNPPPPWAPANGWRRRCEGGGNTVIIIGGGSSRGMGMGMGH